MMGDRQAGPSAATADLVSGKDYHPGHPYRRDQGNPGVVTGLVRQVVGYLSAHAEATTREIADALGVDPKKITDSVKHLKARGEVELAAEPTHHTEPRRWRLAGQTREPQTSAPTPPTAQDVDDAIADLLAMHTGEDGVDPVAAALNRVLLAAEAARAEYLKHRNDPLLDHLNRQVDEAHAAITAWEERRHAKR